MVAPEAMGWWRAASFLCLVATTTPSPSNGRLGVWPALATPSADGFVARVLVSAHGAAGDGVTDDTAAIQAAIDAASVARIAALDINSDVKAAAVLAFGVFLSGTVYLRPGVVLAIDGTAVLKASTNSSLFPRDSCTSAPTPSTTRPDVCPSTCDI